MHIPKMRVTFESWPEAKIPKFGMMVPAPVFLTAARVREA